MGKVWEMLLGGMEGLLSLGILKLWKHGMMQHHASNVEGPICSRSSCGTRQKEIARGYTQYWGCSKGFQTKITEIK